MTAAVRVVFSGKLVFREGYEKIPSSKMVSTRISLKSSF